MDKNGRQKLAPSKRSHPPSHRQEVTKNKSKKEANTRPNSSRIQSEQTKKDSPTQSKKRRSSSPDKNQKSLLKDEECISMRHNLINSNKSRDFEDYDTDHLYLLMDHLHEYSTYCAMNRKYDKGKSSSLLYERVRQEINRRNEGNLAAKGNNLDQDYEDLLQNAEENFQRELEDYDSVTEEKSQELEKKHKKEREEFDHYWQEVAPRKYRKPSPRLIDLMERERRMGITGEFDRAKATKIEVEKLQRIEHSRAQKQLLFDYENAKSKLGKTQSEERESFVNNRQHGREIILSRQSIQLGYLKNRETVLSQRNKEGSPKQEAKHRKSNTMAIVYRRDFKDDEPRLLPELMPPGEIRKSKEKQQRRAERDENKRKHMMLNNKAATMKRYKRENDENTSARREKHGQSARMKIPNLIKEKRKESPRMKRETQRNNNDKKNDIRKDKKENKTKIDLQITKQKNKEEKKMSKTKSDNEESIIVEIDSDISDKSQKKKRKTCEKSKQNNN